MPKLRAPDGRIVSVSQTGVEPMKARGYTALDAASAPPAAEKPEMPSKSDPKADWVAYAEAIGADSSGTKDELVERLGG